MSEGSRYVSGLSRPSLPIALPVQELKHIDREEDHCMQHPIIPFYSMAEGES